MAVKKKDNRIAGHRLVQTKNIYDGVDTRQNFSTIDKFLGYRSREDFTMLSPGYMIPGSTNVLIDVSGRLKSRKGYVIDGQTGTSGKSIISSYDWEEHINGTINFRHTSDGLLQFRYNNGTTVVWETLQSGLSTTKPIRFTNYWDNTEKENLVLYVNGDNNVYQWNGFMATVSSVNANTGIIQQLTVPFGGSGYAINDVVTITGGSGTATAKVTQLVKGAISAVTMTAAGTGYTVGDILSITYGNGSQIFGYGAQIKVVSITGGGGTGPIDTYTLIAGGSGYGSLLSGGAATYPNPVISGGTGASCYFNFTTADTSIASVQMVINGSGYSATNLVATTSTPGTGALVDIISIASNSIIISGTKTLGELGLYASSQNVVVINGIEFTYTGGFGGNTITGVTPSPVGHMTAGDLIFQKVITTSGKNITNVETGYIFDGISMLNNQVYYGSESSDNIYISKVDKYYDCGFTAPVRVVGEGALARLRSYWKAFVPQEELMYISAGDSQWYTNQKVISSDNSKETFTVIPLKTASKQGAYSQETVTKDKNSVVFISNEPVFSSIGRISGVISTPMQGDYSYPIVNDFNGYNFTGAHAKYFKNFIYISIPSSGTTIILNQTDSNNIFWEAPQTFPFTCFSIINGQIYGHSAVSDETYLMFSGYNDNGHPIPSRAVFAYNIYGSKGLSKYFNEFWIDGYISQNTKLTVINNFDIGGFQSTTTRIIDGSNTNLVAAAKSDGSLGKTSLGFKPLGLDSSAISAALPPYFAEILTQPRLDFYFFQPIIESTGKDYHWELLSFGPLVNNTMFGANNLKV